MTLKLAYLLPSFGGSFLWYIFYLGNFLYTLSVKVYRYRQENQISITALPQFVNLSFLLLQSYSINGNQEQSNDLVIRALAS